MKRNQSTGGGRTLPPSWWKQMARMPGPVQQLCWIAQNQCRLHLFPVYQQFPSLWPSAVLFISWFPNVTAEQARMAVQSGWHSGNRFQWQQIALYGAGTIGARGAAVMGVSMGCYSGRLPCHGTLILSSDCHELGRALVQYTNSILLALQYIHCVCT